MGITKSSLDLIFKYGHAKYFKGKKVLTLGTVYPYLDPRDYSYYASRGIRLASDKKAFQKLLFIDVLSVESLKSLDVSSYQDADIIHDLNSELPSWLRASVDLVFDAGTLEHLFDLKTSLINIFSLLSINGVYYAGVVSNNWINHGFYQFSPTFFVDFARHNSDSIELVELIITDPFGGRVWDYFSMGSMQKSVLFNSRLKLGVLGILRKTADKPLRFDVLQSKYLDQYDTNSRTSVPSYSGLHGILLVAKKMFVNSLIGGLSCPVLPFGLRLGIAKIVDRTFVLLRT